MIIILFLLFISASSAGENNKPKWVLNNFTNGDIYEGFMLDDLKHGLGTFTYLNGQKVIKGEWVRGFIFQGEIWDKKYNQYYKGEIKNNKKHGYGKTIWQKELSGHIYEGYYKDGVKSGWGFYKWPNGNKYWGEWDHGERTGIGQYRWPNGDTYRGSFKKGKKSGLGVQYKKNGKHFAGWWKNGNHSSHLVKSKKRSTNLVKPKWDRSLNAPYLKQQKSTYGGALCYYNDGSVDKVSGGQVCPRQRK